ncbi:alanine racemase [Caldimicrobium thiodismutans]|uniref:Alanine racemase n=1 Tax=Caldimicrobium thiodismutans TaxID=1653476 RepID=A0A0U5AGZ0_9BACT|nr:alanine racemase [Caldimicrobium thiodismutans]BAU23251.1 alanine racemase [Caldimicrobium thiodismutans]
MGIFWTRLLEINLYNLKENLRSLRKLLPEEVEILPVIKNDAYGHGLLEVARALTEEKVYGFGISEPYEAHLLRRAGFIHPLILLSGFEKDWLPDIKVLRITPVVTSIFTLEWLIDFTLKKAVTFEFHLKVDTGMHRFGVPMHELLEIIERLRENPQLQLTGLMTHLACSERPEDPIFHAQIKEFKKALSLLTSEGFNPKFVHLYNSAGIIFSEDFKGNLVRPGIALYGGYPCNKARARIRLKPVMTLKSKVVEIKHLKKGEIAGYGPTFTAKRETLLGIIPVGYGDGYPRILSNKGFAVIRGQRVPIVGTISMKALYLDLTEIPSPQLGEEVILLGGEREEVPADELAQLADTISYELFCNLGKIIPRRYKE